MFILSSYFKVVLAKIANFLVPAQALIWTQMKKGAMFYFCFDSKFFLNTLTKKKCLFEPVPSKILWDFKSCLETKFTTVVITRKNCGGLGIVIRSRPSGKKNKRKEWYHTNCKFMAKTWMLLLLLWNCKLRLSKLVSNFIRNWPE